MNLSRPSRVATSLVLAACALLCVAPGAWAAAGDLVLVANSGQPDYGEVTEARHRPAISADGRFVAYVSQAAGQEEGDPLFLRDLRGGAPVQIVHPSQKPSTWGFDNATPVLSDSGRYLAFASEDPDLSPEDPDSSHSPTGSYSIADLFVYDQTTGKMTLVSRRSGAKGTPANDNSSLPSISADGRRVAYATSSSNLTVGRRVIGGVYARDLGSESNQLISGSSAIQFWTSSSFAPDISGDGRRVAFGFDYSADPYDPKHPPRHIGRWLRARHRQIMLADPGRNRPEVVSRSSGRRGAIADDDSRESSVSGNGRFVAFTSSATNLAPGDDNRADDVFVRDTKRHLTTLVSRIGTKGALGDGESESPSISADGRFVAFQSLARNLAPASGDEKPDVFVKDLETGRLILVSKGIGGTDANGSSGSPTISSSGLFVAFGSTASNLSPEDTTHDMSFYRFQVPR